MVSYMAPAISGGGTLPLNSVISKIGEMTAWAQVGEVDTCDIREYICRGDAAPVKRFVGIFPLHKDGAVQCHAGEQASRKGVAEHWSGIDKRGVHCSARPERSGGCGHTT